MVFATSRGSGYCAGVSTSFSHAIKIAIAIGDDANKEKLAQFTGTSEAVFTVHNIDALKKMIRIVAVTSSQVGSQSSSTGDTTKQETTIRLIKDETKDEGGIESGTDTGTATSSDNYDDWN